MKDAFGIIVTTAAVASAGVAGGVYLAFTTMVMPTLRGMPASNAIATMQRVNEMALHPPFMIVFFGGAISAVVLVVNELVTGHVAEHGPLRLIGALLALASFAITVVWNVPLNTMLAGAVPDAGDAVSVWRSFDSGWGAANLVRGLVSVAAVATLALSLVRR